MKIKPVLLRHREADAAGLDNGHALLRVSFAIMRSRR
jgi:hypothetical protein